MEVLKFSETLKVMDNWLIQFYSQKYDYDELRKLMETYSVPNAEKIYCIYMTEIIILWDLTSQPVDF
jgi:hypothetical protein